MPVTARLSKQFYERLGEQVANELVDWFNAVDATYKAELREFNELNFARFDAKVEQRFAQSEARLEQRFAEADVKLERRFAEAEVKMEQRFAEADVKMEQRFAEADVKLEQRFAQSDAKLEQRTSELRGAISDLKAEMIKWMFLFWAGSVVANKLVP